MNKRPQNMPNTQTRISLGLKSAILIAVVFAVFHSEIDLIFTSALRNESSYYVAVIPFIIAYLVYSKRHMLRNVMALDTTRQPKNTKPLAPLAGISLSLVALLLYWRGSYALTPYGYYVLVLPIFASGLTLILFNSETLKQLAFPIFFLLLLYPPPSAITETYALTVMAAIFIILVSWKIYQTRIICRKSMYCSTLHSQTGRNYCEECGRILSPLPARLSRMDVAKIVAIILIASLLTAIRVPETQHFVVDARRPLIVTTTLSNRQSNNSWMPTLHQYNLTFNYEDPTNETPNLPFLDLYLYYYYTPANLSALQIQVIFQMASAPSKLLPYTLSRSAWTQITPPTKIMGAYYYVYQSPLSSEIQAAITWNTSLPVIQGQTIQLKYVELTLYILNVPQDQLQAVKQQLVNLANMTMNYWRQTQPSSDSTVIISEYSTALAGATVAVLIVIIFLYIVEARKRRRISLSAALKLNALDAEIVKTIETIKQPATLISLSATIKAEIGQTLTPEQVEGRLTELEDVGIIRSQIVSQNDVPVRTWKI